MKINFSIFNYKPKTKTAMNKNLSKILGREVQNGEVFNAEDLATIESALNTPEQTTQEAVPTVVTESNAEQNQEDLASLVANAVASAVSPISEQLTAISGRLDVVEGKPGATVTETPKVHGESKKLEAWEDPENPLNKSIDQDLGN